MTAAAGDALGLVPREQHIPHKAHTGALGPCTRSRDFASSYMIVSGLLLSSGSARSTFKSSKMEAWCTISASRSQSRCSRGAEKRHGENKSAHPHDHTS